MRGKRIRFYAAVVRSGADAHLAENGYENDRSGKMVIRDPVKKYQADVFSSDKTS